MFAPSNLEVAPPAQTGPRRCEISLARSEPEVEALRLDWERLNENPNVQMDFYKFINGVRPFVLRPHVIVVRINGAVKSLVVGRLVEHEFRCSVGYKTISCGPVQQLDILHGGLLGDCSGEYAEAILGELIAALQRGEADLLCLNHVKVSSDLFRLARQTPGFLSRDRVVQTQRHWKARLPGSLEEFLRRLNKKHRYWVRRMEKKVEQDFPGRTRYQRFSDYADLGRLANDLEAVAQKTYQRGLGAGFMPGDEQMRRLALARREGWLRGWMLHIDGQPAAFWIGSVYRNVFHSEATGYDPAYRKYELGTLILMKLVEDLCNEKAEAFDFGLGDAQYKQRFGDEHWLDGSVRIYAPSLKGVKLNLMRTVLDGSSQTAQRLFNRLGLEQRLKTLWRKKLAGGKNAPEQTESGPEES
jgi:CelD/BcsL family acetyltransferase involved in cellulose biosynthesis